ncbi:MAG: DUF2202 domain-containing protein [Saprospiraceae bacterium]|nr:DUF2202 domain-containing protein [Saprospiraceae bacterium]
MKKHIKYSFAIIALLLTSLLFTQCQKDDDNEDTSVLTVDGQGNSRFNHGNLSGSLGALPLEALSNEEKSSLAFMREEEKLAHDVYVKMYDQWNIPIFNNIAQSEQTHTDAVLALIDRYDLEDPVGANGVGIFVDTALDNLYQILVPQGEANIIEGLTVGAVIEEIDILDLVNLLDTVVDNQDIRFVYENLLKGSRNHLRAFVKNLENQNSTYTPSYLPTELYQSIIEGQMEQGKP